VRVFPLLLVLLLLSSTLAGCFDNDPPAECDGVDEGFVVSELVSDVNRMTTANVRMGDLDGDGRLDILSTQPLNGWVSWTRCDTDGCTEEILSVGLTAPVRTQVVDFDQDGSNDLLVADIGILPPSDDLAGSVVLLRRDAEGNFSNETLHSGIGRVACAEAADLDGDGDLDIVVCEFGNLNGSVLWLEQEENGSFSPHEIDARPGAIHAFPFDADDDGDLDLAVSLSQLSEEVNLYRNDGEGNFTLETLMKSDNTWFGMSGLEVYDLDGDGDDDIIYTNGDTLDMDLPEEQYPHDVHGAAWLENDGTGQFTQHELARVWGAYTAKPFDADGDGDIDLVIGTLQFDLVYPGVHQIDLVLLENVGDLTFVRHDLRNSQRYMITFDVGDIDGDGEADLVGGSHTMGNAGNAHRLVELSWQPELVWCE